MQIEIFARVKDPRVLGKVKHELEDVLRIALIGLLASCENYDETSDFISERQTELNGMGFLKLGNVVPSGALWQRDRTHAVPDCYVPFFHKRMFLF